MFNLFTFSKPRVLNARSQILISHQSLWKTWIQLLSATLIGRLAVDEKYKREGLGEHILLDALCKSYEITQKIGSFSVVVDLVEEDVRDFYRKYEFRSLSDSKDRLFIPMKKVENLLKEMEILPKLAEEAP